MNVAHNAPAGVEIDERDGFQRIPRGEPERGNAGAGK